MWRSVAQGREHRVFSHLVRNTRQKGEQWNSRMWGIICLLTDSVRQLEQDLLTHTQSYTCGTALWTAPHAAPAGTQPTGTLRAVTGSWLPTSVPPLLGHLGHTEFPPSPPYSRTLLNSTILPPLLVHWTSYQQVPALPRWLHLKT